jgi:hypothetical protein
LVSESSRLWCLHFSLPLGGNFSDEHQSIIIAWFLSWDVLKIDCAAQYCTFLGVTATSFFTPLVALIIKERLGLKDE